MSESSPSSSPLLRVFLPLLPDRPAMWRAWQSLSPLGSALMMAALLCIHFLVPVGLLLILSGPWWLWLCAGLLWPLHWFLQLAWAEACISLADCRSRVRARPVRSGR